jgi:uncharacterized iron-regulated membrane protein
MISLRKFITVTHRWTGLTVGLFAVVLAVTGAGLALRPILDGVVNRRLLVPPEACAATLSLDAQVAAARAAHPRVPVFQTRIDPGANGSTAVRFADNATVYVDPCTAGILGEQGRFEGLFGRIDQLHRLAYWQGGLLNKIIRGGTALVLGLAAVVGGLYLWWPRRRPGAWKRALTLDFALRRRAWALNLHGVSGIYAALIIFVIAGSGVAIAFDWAKQGLYLVTLSQPDKTTKFVSAAPEPGASPVPLDLAWRRLQSVMPSPGSATFRYPHKAGDPIVITAVARNAPHGDARSILSLDAANGAILGFQPYDGLSRGRKLFFWLLAIHTGEAGGWPVDLILFAGVLAVPVLAYTGVESYLRSRRRKRPGKVPERGM